MSDSVFFLRSKNDNPDYVRVAFTGSTYPDAIDEPFIASATPFESRGAAENFRDCNMKYSDRYEAVEFKEVENDA